MLNLITVVVQSSHPWTTPSGGQVSSGACVEVELTPEVQRDLDAGIISIKISPAAVIAEVPEEAPTIKTRTPKVQPDSQEN